jgi:hypothetical protein
MRRSALAAALSALAVIGLRDLPECAGGGYSAMTVDMNSLW